MLDSILTQNEIPWQSDEWQKQLSSSTRTVNEIFDRFSIDNSVKSGSERANEIFRARAPEGFLQQIQSGSMDDPLFRQIFPDGRELDESEGFVTDPLGESASNPVPGLLHKYEGRALIVLTSACAIHCRYCFRRHFPYEENRLSGAQWENLITHIKNDISIEEIILSGGDPLSLKTEQLREKLAPLLALPQISRLRIHSRLPVVLPERIDRKLLQWFDQIRQRIVLVVHANHSREMSDKFKCAMTALQSRKIMLLNQSVLLKGVNDHAATLADLSNRLFDCHVMPYYLHLLDKVAGSAHFDVPDSQAEKIYAQLLSTLPGYLVPKLVREVAHKKHKVPLPVSHNI